MIDTNNLVEYKILNMEKRMQEKKVDNEQKYKELTKVFAKLEDKDNCIAELENELRELRF